MGGPTKLANLSEAVTIALESGTVRILFVADGAISFGEDGFGLGRVIDTLNDTSDPDFPGYTRFAVTTAHRATPYGGTADLTHFRFTPEALAGYHEVWLFGWDGFPPGSGAGASLGADEVSALTDFMNRRHGGVFAAGDHMSMGLTLCGLVPRVRNMRKWWFDQTGAPLPPGESNAPSYADHTCNDTVQPPVPGADPNTGTQGDGTPQPIWPTLYPRGPFHSVGPRWLYPHPVLCGPRGQIRVLPDHPHEGECRLPFDLSQTLIDGSPEYPGGVEPEIIAHASTVAGRVTEAPMASPESGGVVLEARRFPVLCAYDGHSDGADVGRVLVDSSWHHWVNLNLVGLDAAGGDAWADVRAYYRNVALWLAPPGARRHMSMTALMKARYSIELVELLAGRGQLLQASLIGVGERARDALGRLAPRCERAIFLLDEVRSLRPTLWRRINPWEPLVPGDSPRRGSEIEAAAHDLVLTALLGGIVAEIAASLPEAHRMKAADLERRFDEVAARGARAGLAEAERLLEGDLAAVATIVTELEPRAAGAAG